jgi:hypothetical protein
MKDLLITSAYPRSGQTFLNYALKHLYYEDEANTNYHSVSSIEKYDHLFVPFRNPEDCIASWHRYPSGGQLQEDIKYYLRFYKAALENLDKITLMDFNKFTTSLEYIKDKVKGSLDLESVANPTDSEIKLAMLDSGKTINLPVNNKAELDIIKAQIAEMPELQECLNIYNNLLSLA